MQVKDLRKILDNYSEDTEILFEDYSDISVVDTPDGTFITTILEDN